MHVDFLSLGDSVAFSGVSCLEVWWGYWHCVCLCRYRRWKLGEDIDLIVRCEHDGVMTGANGELSFINIKALNEWDSRVRMRKCTSFLPPPTRIWTFCVCLPYWNSWWLCSIVMAWTGVRSWTLRGEPCWPQSWRTTATNWHAGPAAPCWPAQSTSSWGENTHIPFVHARAHTYPLPHFFHIQPGLTLNRNHRPKFYFLHLVCHSYVSRYHVKDSARHVILGTQQFKPNEFASQINLSMENAWGILRCVIDICRKLDEGKYLILKDPNKVSNYNTQTSPQRVSSRLVIRDRQFVAVLLCQLQTLVWPKISFSTSLEDLVCFVNKCYQEPLTFIAAGSFTDLARHLSANTQVSHLLTNNCFTQNF